MCVILVLWGKHEPMARAPLLKDQSVFSLLEFGCASRHFDMFSGTWCHCLTYDMGSWIPLTRYSCHFDIWSKGSNEHIIIASLKFRLFTKLNWLIGDMWNQYYIMIIFVWVEILYPRSNHDPCPGALEWVWPLGALAGFCLCHGPYHQPLEQQLLVLAQLMTRPALQPVGRYLIPSNQYWHQKIQQPPSTVDQLASATRWFGFIMDSIEGFSTSFNLLVSNTVIRLSTLIVFISPLEKSTMIEPFTEVMI